jgi:hypothetical protein
LASLNLFLDIFSVAAIMSFYAEYRLKAQDKKIKPWKTKQREADGSR